MCSEADMRDLGIPMGPRKKLMGFVREQAQQQVEPSFLSSFHDLLSFEMSFRASLWIYHVLQL